ncbi:TOPRIM nucleotidyl transferase/hydrolase domain-containing protein [Kutzneria sp. NPDC052558]|uniref:TOPRIM nucleotidyl transferase/hydrolase domain-containing protein n=1 Tax=Kutzneria sp. NPDC052558 TaxID=3364121 RepID=UPI0037CA7E42
MRDPLAGYVRGPAAATEATAVALARAADAEIVVLVEGVSDQIAVETLAPRLGLDLAAAGIAVLPTGGAHAIGRYLRQFATARSAVLCDAGEAHLIHHGLAQLGVFVCDHDLEDELIRAAGLPLVEEALAAHGDLAAFRIIQRQPAWRGRPEAAQLRRFLAAGAQRKLRYARLLTEAIPLDRMPRPLTSLLHRVSTKD